ncbi:hypothetical protein PV327_005339 [Microctonus hyperodae]|uniref:CCHC-type domain-containing protein n=1 Tax=Microctonus hyperodae TaxID=165561 RepID=A0AA39G1K5_MICHY|nr:hypothetical protein PV327_005339 [Microctonus hyperodae]
MTRFARAKGSKASNERHPEEPTPWHVMKQEIELAAASKKDNTEQKTKSAKELLKEKDDPYYTTTTGNINTDWAEFEAGNEGKSIKEKVGEHSKDTPMKKEKKKRQSIITGEEKENDDSGSSGKTENTPILREKARKRKSTDTISNKQCNDKVDTTAEIVESNISVVKKKKKDKKNKTSPCKIPEVSNSENPTASNVETPEISDSKEHGKETSVKLSKRQKRNRKNKMKSSNDAEVTEDKAEDKNTQCTFNTDGNEWSNDIKFGSKNNVDQKNDSMNSNRNSNQSEDKNHPNNPRMNNFNKFDNKFNNKTNGKKRKPPKIRDDKEHKRRKPNPGISKVIINGMEVEIVMYDGFPIKKDDAERLKDLRQQMVMKGIPKSEIDAAMKLERRKAEKALTRIKKHVCFHCRKAGHNLSDCPDLGKEESATGICFKCGSTEHTHFECKVNKKAEFRFASCFICREQGHIAKQCPDNPKGLYPDGGSCNVCGDVTHLKKDCPELTVKKEQNTLTVSTIAENQLESLDDDKTKKSDNHQVTKSKIVKF